MVRKYYVGTYKDYVTYDLWDAIRNAAERLNKNVPYTRVPIHMQEEMKWDEPRFVYVLPDRSDGNRNKLVYFPHIPGKGYSLGVDYKPMEARNSTPWFLNH